MVETLGLVASIEAADAMLKASEVRLVRQQRVVPGLVTHVVIGETAAVRAAVDAGRAAAERVGKVAGVHVIPRPDPSVWRLFGVAEADDRPAPASPAPASAAPARRAPAASAPAPSTGPASPEADDFDDLTVRELRTLARDRDGGLEGRAIARASKADLVAYLRRSEGGER